MEIKLLIAGIGLLYIAAMVGAYILGRQQQLKRRNVRRHIRKRQIRRRQERIAQAQLEKADFQNRLENFVGEAPREEQPFVSKAEFWELESNHLRSPPRPPSFFRRLLMRITKYVNLSKT